ncbi:substrate-binding periplasmic protein [Epibacterium ulvae]|uniref:substrate-binding periplasmic protein n=1 Tax=Epibacterium ulvae TaxID=1156985 RepID=UPI002490BA7C|nr:transporter substrate-binding domain-containing protein [Epibacterium ulvae]
MTSFSRRTLLQATAAIAASPVLMQAKAAYAAAAYHFVRIEGLAEQAVGEIVLKELYRRADMDITITAMPGRRALQEAASGNKDGETLRVYALGENKPSLIRLETPLSSLQTVAFSKKGADISLSSKEDLANYRNIMVKGVLHTEAITKGINGVQTATDASSMFKMVKVGRADLALTSGFDGLVWVERLGYGNDIEVVNPVLNDQPLYHYVHESKRGVLDVLEPLAASLEASGELNEIRSSAEQAFLSEL